MSPSFILSFLRKLSCASVTPASVRATQKLFFVKLEPSEGFRIPTTIGSRTVVARVKGQKELV